MRSINLIPAAFAVAMAWVSVAGAGEEPDSVPYTWTQVAVVGGGFVTGVICHPTEPGVAYARTDMGGGYRLDPETLQWTPVTDFFIDYMETGIAAVALDPRDPDRVYFVGGTDPSERAPTGELLRSIDRGASWERIPLPLKFGANWPGRSIGERLAVDPQDGRILFLGTRHRGLWRSTNHGSTWHPVDSFPVRGRRDGGAGVGAVWFDGRSGNPGEPTPEVYAAVCAPGTTPLYRSTDAGASWTALPGQPEGLVPHHAALTADGMLYVTYSNGLGPNDLTDGAVWKLDAGTGIWTDITPERSGPGGTAGFGYAGLAMDPRSPDTVVVSSLCRWAQGDELWRSTDGGATWQAFGQAAEFDHAAAPYQGRGPGHWIGGVTIDPLDSDRLWNITGSGIWRTDNLTDIDSGGQARFQVGAVGIEQTAILDLVSPPAGAPLLSAMRDLGGFRHIDLARSPATGSFDNPRVSETAALDVAGRNPDIVVRGGRPGWGSNASFAAWSEDNGATWTPLPLPPQAPGPPCDWVAVAADGHTIIASVRGLPPHWTRDHGTSWTACTGLDRTLRMVVADRVNADVFYGLGSSGRGSNPDALGQVFRSTDGGNTFAPVGRIPGLSRVGRMRAMPDTTGTLWVPGWGAGLFRSTDGGETFKHMAGMDTAETVGFGKPAPGQSHPAVYVTGAIGSAYGVFRSDDGEGTWIRLNDDQHQYGNLCFATTGDPRVYGRVYVGTNGRGILLGEPATP